MYIQILTIKSLTESESIHTKKNRSCFVSTLQLVPGLGSRESSLSAAALGRCRTVRC